MRAIPHILMTEKGIKILEAIVKGYLFRVQGNPLPGDKREKDALEKRVQALLAVQRRIQSLLQNTDAIERATFYLSFEEIGAVAVAIDAFLRYTCHNIPVSQGRDTVLARVERLYQWFMEALSPLP